jgi:hypothetical protein
VPKQAVVSMLKTSVGLGLASNPVDIKDNKKITYFIVSSLAHNA